MEGWNQGEYEKKRRIKNVWIEIFGEEKSCLWVEENCVFTEKLLNNNKRKGPNPCKILMFF
jgi:hypothetical protein